MLIHRPEVYDELYDEHGEPKLSAEEKDVEWIVPETEADVDSMMADLRAMGYRG